ncbi:DUF3307 domain-containing protein [Aequorivita vladivostokensis]|uniref:DUF3307 domain-containing protein n=1 Tax=Aequorivita vladivostokensis TaxID=171194 RepID=A0ABR5DJH4_9FLAO|nr:DUF3307 domain-containing protein [Aequorivita vladivostokensis]MAB55976.1 DUF3307 domain-containing protein [Aequorivita sp.]KJJ38929.1 hypothetical protein MB09_05685 [Aequorivita vladivostokensis]MAO49017.1 DUF3307 domain-containing protein [Aequorivita sp.]MBF30738.1 DUF3307 domain-containing protein [Aequorivita sp.]HAV55267.1 DUF3307 domain-containing protein [Aequorivita sp.]|tara:strand:- start:106100 stop:106804 length:705 start_codon:yes stop_codon:yes gene_type:complete
MGLKELLLLQFIAHLCLDYFFQTDRLAKQKNTIGFKSPFLYWHALACFALAWLFSLLLSFVLAAAIISISHFILDGFKRHLNNSRYFGRYAFFIDQAAHLAILVIVVVLFNKWHGINPSIEVSLNFKYLLIITGYLVCLKPANIFIREVFKATEIQVSSDNEMPNAGKVIGVLERILTLTFIIVSQYSAVGFLIAAKSILRYGNNETLKTEYVLIGTMLSFGIAVIAGIIINFF